jgi:PAS domain S-box-containing protein
MALRYALAPICIAVAVLVHISVIGPFLHPTALFLACIVVAAWFGGTGPGFLAALLATFALPQLIAMSYPLIAGFFDLPRFLAFGMTGVAVGWGTTFRRRAEAALRQSELELRKARDELEMRVLEQTAELRRSEAYLADAQRLSRTGSWAFTVNSETAVYWSEENFRIWGFDRRQGLPDRETVLQRIHAEDRDAAREHAEKAVRDRTDYACEFRIVLPDGDVRHIHALGHHVFSPTGDPVEVIGTHVDVTERKRAEERLVVQHTVTQLLAEAATVEEATPKILRAIGECLGWDVGALWRVDREPGVLRCVEVWHKGSVQVPEFESASRERTFLPGIGLPGKVWLSREPRYISDLLQEANFQRTPIAARERLQAAFGFPILLGGEVLGVIEFFSREIRQPDQELLNMLGTIGSQIGQFIERKRAEQALLGAQAELAHVTRVATLGELAASIAHETNQPLGAMVNNASACLRWLAANNLEEARRSAELIRADGHRAGEIIQRIRSFAKKAPPQQDWIDINQSIREVIALARSELQRHNVSLETQLSGDVPLVFADRIQLQQVILNLIMNAVEAMSETSDGPRELLIRTGTDGSGGIVVAVRDSGPGLAPENLDRLFIPFYTTKPQGMGMGLAICRSIVEAHGGRLRAIANDDRGATFQFTLPTGDEKTATAE